MNMRVLRRSRKWPNPGDVFSFQVRESEFMFGRVISVAAQLKILEGVIMAYIYQGHTTSRSEWPQFHRDQLLLPPILTNREPWLKGYFETIGNVPLARNEVLPIHCFQDSRGWYFDERGNRLAKRVEPCGDYGLHSYRTIDDAISQTLGIPLAQD